MCISCHSNIFRGSEPYMVSRTCVFAFRCLFKLVKGFYTISNQSSTSSTRTPRQFNPSHSAPLRVLGKYHWTAHSQVSSEHLLILHFILDGMSSTGSPFQQLVGYMKAFLDSSRFFSEEIVFDFSKNIITQTFEQKLRILCQSFR
jgi:hypothetical protein